MRTAATLLVVCFLIGADSDAEAVKKEMALLDGEWTMLSGERDGQAIPEEFLKSARRVTKAGVTTVTIGEDQIMKSKFTIDPTKKPKSIDYTVLEGPNKDQTMKGIYELNGDKVKFCYAPAGKDRPTEFKSKEGSEYTLSEWKKEKK